MGGFSFSPRFPLQVHNFARFHKLSPRFPQCATLRRSFPLLQCGHSHIADGAIQKHVRSEQVKDIKAILSEHGEALSDDARQAIISAVGENYRSVAEMNSKADRIKALEEQNEALTEQVGKLEGDGEELETLRKQVSDFEAAEEERKAQEDEQAKRNAFRATFDNALGDNEFANDLIRDTVFEKVYAQCSATTGADAKSVLEETVKDMDGVWKNPQHDPKRMPNPEDIKAHDTSDATKRSKHALADTLFGQRSKE